MKVTKTRILLSAATLALLTGSSAMAIPTKRLDGRRSLGTFELEPLAKWAQVRAQSTRQARRGWQPAGTLVWISRPASYISG